MSNEVDNTLEDRGKMYGEFFGHARISQELKDTMHCTDRWEDLSLDKREALDMIAHKIARILNGSPDHRDNWHDIAGYSTLVDRRLAKDE